MLNIYVASTSRKCGKSFITAGLAATMQSLGFGTCVYKPVQTSGIEKNGFMQSPDLTYVKSIDPYIETLFTYLYKTSSEPLIASEIENEPISMEVILNDYKKLSASFDCTVVDGDCGIESPIAQNLTNIGLIKKLKLPVLLLTVPDENSVNNTLLTINYLQEKDIQIRGVLINNIKNDCDKLVLNSIPRLVEEYTNTKILGLVENLGEKVTPQELISAILNGIDIESVFDVKIEKLDYV